MMYFYWSIPQSCNFSKDQHKLPEDGPIGLKHVGANLELRHPCCVCNIKVQCREVKTQQVWSVINDINWTTCFGLLRGHHQVQQAIGDNIFHGFKLLDVEISSSNSLNPWNILSPIACWTWWWPLSRPKHVIQLTSFITDQTCCVLTSLHCTFM